MGPYPQHRNDLEWPSGLDGQPGPDLDSLLEVDQLPAGTVTFLFTDIEGSTRLWESSPDHMRDSLVRHDAIIRSVMEGHGGYVFATGGDGFAVAFHRVGSARLRQRALRSSWQPSPGLMTV